MIYNTALIHHIPETKAVLAKMTPGLIALAEGAMGKELTGGITEMLEEGNSFILNSIGQVDWAALNEELKTIPMNIKTY